MTNTVAEAIADELAQAGIDRVFGMPGGEVLFLMDALRRRNISFELCRHEANAGIMAAVYGRLKGVPGVVLTTLGPGAANLMLPLSNSLLDREPLLAISAQVPAGWPKSHSHQRLPLLESYGPVTKFAAALEPYTARTSVRRALQACFEEPGGPAYLTLSADEAIKESLEQTSEPGRAVDALPPTVGDPAKAAVQLHARLAAAERPLVLLGLGLQPADAESLRRWLEAWNLPVAVTPKVKGWVDETNDNFVGVLGGMAVDGLMVDALKHADLLVGFGFDPVEVDKTWHADLPIVWALQAPLALQIVPQHDLVSARHTELLAHLLEMEPPQTWHAAFRETQQRLRDIYTNGGSGNLRENPVAVVRTLAEALPPETIVTTDVGSHKYIFGQFWPSEQPQTFFMSNGLSGMGYGLPAAIGAKLARPDAPVIAALGDAGFSMNSQELETMQRLGAPVITVVMADKSLSLIHHGQQSRGLPKYGVEFDPIDSVKTAEACGVEGVRVDAADELGAIVAGAVKENRALVVEIPVEIAAYSGLV